MISWLVMGAFCVNVVLFLKGRFCVEPTVSVFSPTQNYLLLKTCKVKKNSHLHRKELMVFFLKIWNFEREASCVYFKFLLENVWKV